MTIAATSLAAHKTRDTVVNTRTIVECVRANPSVTRLEIGDITGLPSNIVSGRVNELVKKKVIYEDGIKFQRTGRTG